MRTNFDHEKLEVYQESIKFVAWADALLEAILKHLAVHNQGIVAMLVGLIQSTSPSRGYEASAEHIVNSTESRD